MSKTPNTAVQDDLATRQAHTPGPFKVITRGNQLGIRRIVVVSVPEGNKPVHRPDGVTPEHLATAHLFAAAPELLDALKALVLWDSGDEDFMADAAEYCTVNHISTVAYEEMLYRRAQAAIAKAEGR